MEETEPKPYATPPHPKDKERVLSSDASGERQQRNPVLMCFKYYALL
jgi:hypothetical protein